MADQTLAQGGALNESNTPDPNTSGQPGHGAFERVVPGETGGRVYFEHLGRYEFASQFVRGMRVLDVACGAGYGAQILCGAGASTYVGVDISSEALRLAETRYKVSENISFVLGDACTLDGIGDSTIDVAVSFETIEHLPDPRRFLARIRDTLVPGGILIISTPNRALSNPAGALTSKPPNPFHIREWTTAEFTRLLSGFFIVERSLGQGPYPYWKVLARHLIARFPSMRWLRHAYRSANPLRERSGLPSMGDDAPVPPQSFRAWECPTFVVCLCRRPPIAQAGEASAPRGL